jgi:uncharacterized protein YqeY
MRLRDKINEDLTAAMKAREAARLSVLRMMKTAVKLKETDLRAELTDAQAMQVFATLIKQRKDSVEQYTLGGRKDLADKEAAEIKIIEEYLPAGIADDELAQAVDEVIHETGAASLKDLGMVMRQCMARFEGKLVDGKKINALVKERLEKNNGDGSDS